MATVGRNDPCPCGSGKKYKHCHMRTDQQKERQHLRYDRAWQSLGRQIQQFGIQERFASDFVAAWELYWDNRIPIEAMQEMDAPLHARFLDWFFYNYRTGRERKRIAELFLEEHQTVLSHLEQDLAREWARTYVTVYEVTGMTEASIDLRDVFMGDSKAMQDERASQYLSIDSLLMGRLLPLGDTLRFTPGVTPIASAEKEDLLAFIQPRFESWQQARYGAGWLDFLRESGYLINHFLIRNLEPMERPGAAEPDMTPIEAARSIARRMQSEIITTALDLRYERWLDESVPEWGGKTPREMVRTPEGTEMVEAFLDLLENVERERAQSGQPTYNVNLLRYKLGLTGEVRTKGGILLPG